MARTSDIGFLNFLRRREGSGDCHVGRHAAKNFGVSSLLGVNCLCDRYLCRYYSRTRYLGAAQAAGRKNQVQEIWTARFRTACGQIPSAGGVEDVVMRPLPGACARSAAVGRCTGRRHGDAQNGQYRKSPFRHDRY
jgi:hypothetical protein